MDRNNLQHQVAYARRSLFDQGYLDQEQFVQLEELQDDANPNFVEEIVSSFYNKSSGLIQNIEQTIGNRPIDFGRLDNILHQFMGNSSSVGAQRVRNACTQFREYCNAGNAEGCVRTLQLVKQEYATLRRRLEAYFQMVKQARQTETA